MLFPRFSTRRLLVLIVGAALVSLVLAQAARGESWAVAFTIAGVAYLLTHFIHAALFFVAWLVSLAGGRRQRAVGSPFAAHATPTLALATPNQTTAAAAALPPASFPSAPSPAAEESPDRQEILIDDVELIDP